jgi:hypothetical protein
MIPSLCRSFGIAPPRITLIFHFLIGLSGVGKFLYQFKLSFGASWCSFINLGNRFHMNRVSAI